MERYSTEVNRLTIVFEEHISASVNQGGLDAHTDDSVFSFFPNRFWPNVGSIFFEKNRHGHLPLDSLNWDTPKDLKTERLGAIQYAAVYGRN